MTTENSNSENEELKKNSTEVNLENTENQNNETQIPEDTIEHLVEHSSIEISDSTFNHSVFEHLPTTEQETEQDTEQEEEQDETDYTTDSRTVEQVVSEMEKIINSENAGAKYKTFNQLKNLASLKIQEETEDKKHEFLAEGNPEQDFHWEHRQLAKVSGLVSIFKEKYDEFVKEQKVQQAENLINRQNIIERLKNLYTNTEVGTNLFKEIREIKYDWANAGQVAKSEFKILNNNYFHHLNQFYAMLDLNKEYLEQEYAHNLEKRLHIIERAKALIDEPVQKALNELQYLHKLWKEEAEPVAEEFREKTWDEFKDISNKIHERKSELSATIEKEKNDNLEKKNQIIESIKKLATPDKTPNHSYWQNAIKKVEDLRSEFLKLGSVPRKLSSQNWNDFKQTLRSFNTIKNDFYKSLKGSQISNLEEKIKLIQIAKDNMHSEDWETMVPLYKKLQDDWKKIGHVPRNQANKIWDEFRDACNSFFENYREKNVVSGDNWKENYKLKKALLEELKSVGNEDDSVEQISQIKTKWNAIGKVPREKISINSEFNKVLKEKLKLNKANEFDLKDENLSESQITDKARKMKNQISDLEAEIVKLENNLGFFSNPTRENPLLKDTFDKIDEKKEKLESLKQSLHNIISGE